MRTFLLGLSIVCSLGAASVGAINGYNNIRVAEFVFDSSQILAIGVARPPRIDGLQILAIGVARPPRIVKPQVLAIGVARPPRLA